MENPANESGRKKRLFYVIYLKVGFYIPAFTAHLSAWLAPKCFLALSVLIESVLSCLGGPAAFLASVSKVPPAPAPPPPPLPDPPLPAVLICLCSVCSAPAPRGEERSCWTSGGASLAAGLKQSGEGRRER